MKFPKWLILLLLFLSFETVLYASARAVPPQHAPEKPSTQSAAKPAAKPVAKPSGKPSEPATKSSPVKVTPATDHNTTHVITKKLPANQTAHPVSHTVSNKTVVEETPDHKEESPSSSEVEHEPSEHTTAATTSSLGKTNHRLDSGFYSKLAGVHEDHVKTGPFEYAKAPEYTLSDAEKQNAAMIYKLVVARVAQHHHKLASSAHTIDVKSK